MQMYERYYYDQIEQVVWIDLSNLRLSQSALDELVAGLSKLAQSLPQKVYALVCWKDTLIPPQASEYYGLKSTELLQYFKGLIRYEATNPFTNITIRSQAVLTHTQGSKANFYPSKQAALEAVRALRKAQV